MQYKIGDKVEFVGAQTNLFRGSVFQGEIVESKGLIFKKYRILYGALGRNCEWFRRKSIIRIAKER